jgi:hypothetical protein
MFKPPEALQAQQYASIPKSLDDVFNAYIGFKDRERAEKLQGAQLASQGVDPSFIDPRLGQMFAPLLEKSRQKTRLSNISTVAGLAKEGIDPGDAVGEDLRGLVTQTLGRFKADREQKRRLTESEISKNEGAAGMAKNKQIADAEEGLRKELSVLSKPFADVRDAMGRIRASASNPSAAGDLALIFNYMKVLDPGSTVREGEFATAQNSAGIPERLRAQYNKVISGERLGDDQRKDFVDRAEGLYGSQLSIQKRQEDEYRRLAKGRGANPENVVIDRALPPAQAVAQAQPGQPITKTLKDGRTVQVMPLGNGKYRVVK